MSTRPPSRPGGGPRQGGPRKGPARSGKPADAPDAAPRSRRFAAGPTRAGQPPNDGPGKPGSGGRDKPAGGRHTSGGPGKPASGARDKSAGGKPGSGSPASGGRGKPATGGPGKPRPPAPAKPRKPGPAKAAPGTGAEGDRIAKVIARAGVASRREAEKMIEAGRVAVNGKTIDRAALNVSASDRIEVDGRALDAPEPARLWLYHKPAGLVTTARDEQGRTTIFDELPEDLPRVMTVGRLDLNSEGLLLLTNDGAIKRRLELPSTGWLRRYRVRMKGRPQDADFEPLRDGITIDGDVFQPMTVTLDRQQGANAWATVGLREGKNREIRRAMEAIGLSVNRLIRISYGPFQLGQLKPGAVEEIRPRVLRDQLGMAEAEDDGGGRARPKVTRRRPRNDG